MLKKISLFLLLLISGSTLFSQVAHVKWTLSTKKISDCEYDLKFSAVIEDTWHMYSINPTDAGPLPTVFKFKKTDGVEVVGKIVQSKPITEFDKVFEAKVEFFEHTASFTQRVKLKTDKIQNVVKISVN